LKGSGLYLRKLEVMLSGQATKSNTEHAEANESHKRHGDPPTSPTNLARGSIS